MDDQYGPVLVPPRSSLSTTARSLKPSRGSISISHSPDRTASTTTMRRPALTYVRDRTLWKWLGRLVLYRRRGSGRLRFRRRVPRSQLHPGPPPTRWATFRPSSRRPTTLATSPPTVNQQTEYVTIDENNQQITLTGSYLLNSDGSAPTLTVGPPSDDTTITVNSATDTQVVATLNVANGSYPSLSSINLTTDNGEDGPRSLRRLSRRLQHPGRTVYLAPRGSRRRSQSLGDNIGTSPTISISPGDITYSFTPSSGGGVTGTVNVPASETATEAIVTIVPRSPTRLRRQLLDVQRPRGPNRTGNRGCEGLLHL